MSPAPRWSSPADARGARKPRRARSALHAVRALTDLALPLGCAGCGRPDHAVCPDCAADLAAALWPAGPVAARPRPVPAGLPPVHSAGRYAGSLAAVVAAYKDDGRRDCEGLLGRLLAGSLDAAVAGSPELLARWRRGDGPVLVVPVPSSAAARRRRGDAPLRALAERAVSGLGPGEAVLADALRARRRVADQAALGARERAVNLEHAMAVRPRWERTVEGAACVVVDDVLTTGSTLVEAARALRAAGAAVVVAATICATQRRSGPREPTDAGAPSHGLERHASAGTRAHEPPEHGIQGAHHGLRVNTQPIPVSQTSGVVYRRYMAPLAPVHVTRTGRLGRGPKGALRQGAEPQDTPTTGRFRTPAWRCCRG